MTALTSRLVSQAPFLNEVEELQKEILAQKYAMASETGNLCSYVAPNQTKYKHGLLFCILTQKIK